MSNRILLIGVAVPMHRRLDQLGHGVWGIYNWDRDEENFYLNLHDHVAPLFFDMPERWVGIIPRNYKWYNVVWHTEEPLGGGCEA